MTERQDVEPFLLAAGLTEEHGLWRDAHELVGAVLSPVGVFVGWIDVAWPHPGMPEPRLRDVVHIPLGEIEDGARRAVERARRRADKGKRTCRYCGGRFVPGHMHSKDVCQGCAERELGVVY
jgi:hypothetical protein